MADQFVKMILINVDVVQAKFWILVKATRMKSRIGTWKYAEV